MGGAAQGVGALGVNQGLVEGVELLEDVEDALFLGEDVGDGGVENCGGEVEHAGVDGVEVGGRGCSCCGSSLWMLLPSWSDFKLDVVAKCIM